MALETLVQSDEFQTYLQELRKSVDQPQNLSVMDMIEILFQHIDSIRTRDWKLFTDSIRLMLPYVLPYDNTNNGRWLPVLCSVAKCGPTRIKSLFSGIGTN